MNQNLIEIAELPNEKFVNAISNLTLQELEELLDYLTDEEKIKLVKGEIDRRKRPKPKPMRP